MNGVIVGSHPPTKLVACLVAPDIALRVDISPLFADETAASKLSFADVDSLESEDGLDEHGDKTWDTGGSIANVGCCE